MQGNPLIKAGLSCNLYRISPVTSKNNTDCSITLLSSQDFFCRPSILDCWAFQCKVHSFLYHCCDFNTKIQFDDQSADLSLNISWMTIKFSQLKIEHNPDLKMNGLSINRLHISVCSSLFFLCKIWRGDGGHGPPSSLVPKARNRIKRTSRSFVAIWRLAHCWWNQSKTLIFRIQGADEKDWLPE